jgi:hypothetical protein
MTNNLNLGESYGATHGEMFDPSYIISGGVPTCFKGSVDLTPLMNTMVSKHFRCHNLRQQVEMILASRINEPRVLAGIAKVM